jgi:hypothetical protein
MFFFFNISITCSLYENIFKSESFSWCDICPKKHKVPMIKATSKVLLSGHGADELFGGYSRYLTAYTHKSEDAFRQEIVRYKVNL